MTQAVTQSSTTTYAYDYAGNRVNQTVGNVTTIYPNKYYSITSSTNGATTTATTTVYVWNGDTLIATINQVTVNGTNSGSSTTRYIYPDHLGSTNIVADENGSVVDDLEYYPYGETRINEPTYPTDAQRQFIGQFKDGNSLSYLNARYYDSSRGQFESEDPVFLALGNNDQVKQLTQQETVAFLSDPQQMNSYSYGRDNPILMRDPNGLASMFSKDPLLATLELYGYVSIVGDVKAYFSNGSKSPATKNNQTAQLQLDGVLGTAGFLATETEGAVLTVGGTVLQGVDAYCSGHTCKDFSDSQNTTPSQILASLRPSAGSVPSPYGLSNGMNVSPHISQSTTQISGQGRAQLISSLQSLVNALSGYLASISVSTPSSRNSNSKTK
jgi:RHS repeat-associated protein